jgi:hypothetical protein
MKKLSHPGHLLCEFGEEETLEMFMLEENVNLETIGTMDAIDDEFSSWEERKSDVKEKKHEELLKVLKKRKALFRKEVGRIES